MFLSIKSWLTAAGALFVRDCGVRVSDAVSAARSLDRRRAAMTDGEIYAFAVAEFKKNGIDTPRHALGPARRCGSTRADVAPTSLIALTQSTQML
jgi:hypothetical protein